MDFDEIPDENSSMIEKGLKNSGKKSRLVAGSKRKTKIISQMLKTLIGPQMNNFILRTGLSFLEMKKLKLENCRIKYLPRDLTKFKCLKELSLKDNNISDVDCRQNQHFFFQNGIGLEILDLSCNFIKKLPAQFFVYCQNLKHLYLSKNQLKRISKSFSKLKNLKVLHIDGNDFTQLPVEITKMVNLEEMKLEWPKYLTPQKAEILRNSSTKFINPVSRISLSDRRKANYNITLSRLFERIQTKKISRGENRNYYIQNFFEDFNLYKGNNIPINYFQKTIKEESQSILGYLCSQYPEILHFSFKNPIKGLSCWMESPRLRKNLSSIQSILPSAIKPGKKDIDCPANRFNRNFCLFKKIIQDRSLRMIEKCLRLVAGGQRAVLCTHMIMYSIKEGYPCVTKFLIKKKFSLKACDDRGNSLIHYLYRDTSIEPKYKANLIKKLLSKGCGPNDRNSELMTPLGVACHNYNLINVVLSLEWNKEVEKKQTRYLKLTGQDGSPNKYRRRDTSHLFDMLELDSKGNNIIHILGQKPNLNLIYTICKRFPELLMDINNHLKIPHFYVPDIYLTSKKLVLGITKDCMIKKFCPKRIPKFFKTKKMTRPFKDVNYSRTTFDEFSDSTQVKGINTNINFNKKYILKVKHNNLANMGNNTKKPKLFKKLTKKKSNMLMSSKENHMFDIGMLDPEIKREFSESDIAMPVSLERTNESRYWNYLNRIDQAQESMIEKKFNDTAGSAFSLQNHHRVSRKVLSYLFLVQKLEHEKSKRKGKRSILHNRKIPKTKFIAHLNSTMPEEKESDQKNMSFGKLFGIAKKSKNLFLLRSCARVLKVGGNGRNRLTHGINRLKGAASEWTIDSRNTIVSKKFLLDEITGYL